MNPPCKYCGCRIPASRIKMETCDRRGALMPNYMAAYIGDDTVCPKCW